MDSLGKALRALRVQKRLTQIQVAELLTLKGLPTHNNVVSRWEQGKGEPSLRQFFCLCDLYGVDDVLGTFWKRNAPFLNDQGRQLVDAVREAVEKSGMYAPSPPAAPLRHIRLYESAASAGTGEFLEDAPYSWVEVDDLVPRDADFGIPITGDSMEPRFTSGQVVWVHEQNTLENGQVGIFSLNGEAYIKKLETANGRARLVSYNEDYMPIELGEDDTLTVFGRVVG